jgi:hypothetical protein
VFFIYHSPFTIHHSPLLSGAFMEMIRKIQTVENGQVQVELPMRFWGQQVEIIIFQVPQQEQPLVQKKSLLGCLHQYANPALIPYEHEAWQNALGEKYGSR